MKRKQQLIWMSILSSIFSLTLLSSQVAKATITTPIVTVVAATELIHIGGHAFAVRSDGSLWAWGSDLYLAAYEEYGHGLLGDGSDPAAQVLPRQIGSGYKLVTVSSLVAFAIKADNTLWAWGANGNDYPFGDGTSGSSNVPKPIGTDYNSIATNGHSTVALKTDSSLWTWGSNRYGQLGDGTHGFLIKT